MRLLNPLSSSGTKAGKKKPGKTTGAGAKAATPRRQRPVSPWRDRLIAAAVAVAAFSGTGAVIGWTVQSGRAAEAWTRLSQGAVQMTADAGLRIEDVTVAGRVHTRPDALLDRVDVRRGAPILAVDLAATRERLLSLPWVADARIERRLPDTLHIALDERRPLALWQRDRELTLVDDGGVAIEGQDLRQFHDLPIIIGDEAPQRAAAALAMLSAEPDLGKRVRALTWVGGRRWTVRLDNGMDVQLPELDPAGAWTHLATLAREHGVLERDVVTIDLRIPDQLIMRVTPAARQRSADRGENT